MKLFKMWSCKVKQMLKLLSPIPVVLKAEGEEPTKDENSNKPNPDSTKGETEPNEGESSRLNYEDLISRARKEEKDKLYPKIATLEKERDSLVGKNNNLLIENGELKIQVENLKKQVEAGGNVPESETIKSKDKEIKKLQKELEDLKGSIVDREVIENEVREQLKAEFEVKEYRLEVLAKTKDAGEGVIPELVIGTTKEEIDASLETSKNRYKELFAQTITQHSPLPMSSPSTTGFLDKKSSLEELASLDPRSPEYREARKKLGLK